MAPSEYNLEHSQDTLPRDTVFVGEGPLATDHCIYTSNETWLAFKWYTNQTRPGWYFFADVTHPQTPQVRERILRVPDRYFGNPGTNNEPSEEDTDDFAEEAEAAAQLENPAESVEEEPGPSSSNTPLPPHPSQEPEPEPRRDPVRHSEPERRPISPSSHSTLPHRTDVRLHTPANPPPQFVPPTAGPSTRAPTPHLPSNRPSTTPNTMSKPTELKIGQPKPFSGDRATTVSFIQSCKNYFAINDLIYDTDIKKIGFALSFMTEDIAASWAAAIIKEGQARSPVSYGTWVDFVSKIETAFSPISASADAVFKLKMLNQGTGSADEYVAKFRNIVGLADFKDLAFLIDKFLDGLHPSLRDSIMKTTAEMKTLEDYYTVATRVDERRKYDKIFSRQSNNFTHFRRNIRQVTSPDQNVTIQKLSPAERDKLRREGKCFRCRKAGHMSRECPNGRPPSRTVRQIEVTTEAKADEDVSVGRIISMMTKLPPGERETLTKKMVDEGF